MVKNLGVESNLSVLLDLFGGDLFRCLEKVRQHNKIELTMSAKSVERLAIKLLIAHTDWDDRRISHALSDGDNVIRIERVERLRKEIQK